MEVIFKTPDTLWRPKAGITPGAGWGAESGSNHLYPPDGMIPFPPPGARQPLAPLSGHEWAESAGWKVTDWQAFQAFGPAGFTVEDQASEGAGEWQDVLALLRRVLLDGWNLGAQWTWTPVGEPDGVASIADLRAEVGRRIEAGEVQPGQHQGAPALVATSIAAFLLGTAAHAVARGQVYVSCEECRRLMPIRERGGRRPVWCSEKCRARTLRRRGS